MAEPFRSGDVVKHRPSGETWTLAYYRRGWVAWYGWPEGEAKATDCELVEACTDEEHRKSLEEWGGKVHRRDDGSLDSRFIVCAELLAELNRD